MICSNISGLCVWEAASRQHSVLAFFESCPPEQVPARNILSPLPIFRFVLAAICLAVVVRATGAEICAISTIGTDEGQCDESPCATIEHTLAVGCTDVLVQAGKYRVAHVCTAFISVCHVLFSK